MLFPFFSESTADFIPMSTSAQRALQVEEVLGAIFRHLSPYRDGHTVLTAPDRLDFDHAKDFSHLGVEPSPCAENQRALVQCSRVSRTIGPHALQVLWRTLPDLRPLQHLLDVMGYSYADRETGIPFQTFPTHVEPHDNVREWRRYRWYASCVIGVRSLIDYNALEEWSDRGGPPLLPRLKRVRYRYDARSIHRTLRMIVASVRDLTLNFDSSGPSTGENSRSSTVDVLTAAARLAPAIEVLNLTFRAPPKDIYPVLPQFTHLRVLVVTGWMTASLHQAIAALEHLELLYVKLYWSRQEETDIRNLPFRIYRSAKTLVAQTLTDPINYAIQYTELPEVEQLRLEIWPHSSDATEGMMQLIESIRKRAPKLRRLTLKARSAATHGDRPPPKLVTVIEPLLHKPELHTICITLEDNYSFALTRSDILSFPTAWPNIVTLCLAHAPTAATDALPPIKVFFDFVAACPRLETLVLCARFDCTARSDWQLVTIPPHKALRGLFLGLDPETGSYNPGRTWLVLAAALDRSLPLLDLDKTLDLVRPAVVGAQAIKTWEGVVKHIGDLRSGAIEAPCPLDW
ncbi:hypothetical protein BD413DRAFT_486756 [Trametes elegans]|nr:hypothetical protein BD413DRAFT_486756 [Trametes elegans]